ncbi:MAG: PAC2 family protein [Anaerolineales bacterium]|nr:PAC2 family protein [Anaerolineales bacterium]
MSDAVELFERPEADEKIMFVGWRQWADAGSMSSGLPQYLIQLIGARKIGNIKPDGFYLFQFPGTHDLIRPVIKFEDGMPISLEAPRNELYFGESDGRGIVIFVGDEPHFSVERYIDSILEAARTLGVGRIIGFGGVYGELPYDRERLVSGIYSLPHLKGELNDLSVNLSDYQGGASIGAYLCKRAGEQGIEFLSFYAFVPTYEFSGITQAGSSIRIENDHKAWYDVLRRVSHMQQLNLDLSDLEEKSARLMEALDSKVEELDQSSPQLGVRDYMNKLSDRFSELAFDPLEEVWEDELRRLSDKFDLEE